MQPSGKICPGVIFLVTRPSGWQYYHNSLIKNQSYWQNTNTWLQAANCKNTSVEPIYAGLGSSKNIWPEISWQNFRRMQSQPNLSQFFLGPGHMTLSKENGFLCQGIFSYNFFSINNCWHSLTWRFPSKKITTTQKLHNGFEKWKPEVKKTRPILFCFRQSWTRNCHKDDFTKTIKCSSSKKNPQGFVFSDALLVDVFVVSDVLNKLRRRQQLLGVVVGNLEAELILHGHDDLHVVERVQAQIVDEVGLKGQLQESEENWTFLFWIWARV